MGTMNAKDPKFAALVDDTSFRFSLIGNVKSEKWSQLLLDEDVLLNPELDIVYSVRMVVDPTVVGETQGAQQVDSTQQKLESCGSYRVHS